MLFMGKVSQFAKLNGYEASYFNEKVRSYIKLRLTHRIVNSSQMNWSNYENIWGKLLTTSTWHKSS